MAGEIEDKRLRDIWNACADKLNELHIYYNFSNIEKDTLDYYKLRVIKGVKEYEKRLGIMNLTHAQANPQNKEWNFREVVKKYV